MIRRGCTILVLAALLVTGGLWVAAACIAISDAEGRPGLFVGLAGGERWLANALVQPNGHVTLQYFDENLTDRDGFYVKPLRWNPVRPRAFPSSLVPYRSSSKYAERLSVHLLPPVAVLGPIGVALACWPLVRRHRRRMRRDCPACGYSLRDHPSPDCPECGRTNPCGRAATSVGP